MLIDFICYINLDIRADRRAHMEKMLSGAPVPPVRISAIDTQASLKSRRIPMHESHRNQPVIGAIFLSHRRAIETASCLVKSGAAVVIEDDCHIPQNVWTNLLPSLQLPGDWQMLLVNPRFRNIGSSPRREKLAWYRRINPFKEKYWQKPLRYHQPQAVQHLLEKYVISGAHFIVFRDLNVLQLVASKMDALDEAYHVDHFYCREVPGCYAVQLPGIFAAGFGSDNKA